MPREFSSKQVVERRLRDHPVALLNVTEDFGSGGFLYAGGWYGRCNRKPTIMTARVFSFLQVVIAFGCVGCVSEATSEVTKEHDEPEDVVENLRLSTARIVNGSPTQEVTALVQHVEPLGGPGYQIRACSGRFDYRWPLSTLAIVADDCTFEVIDAHRVQYHIRYEFPERVATNVMRLAEIRTDYVTEDGHSTGNVAYVPSEQGLFTVSSMAPVQRVRTFEIVDRIAFAETSESGAPLLGGWGSVCRGAPFWMVAHFRSDAPIRQGDVWFADRAVRWHFDFDRADPDRLRQEFDEANRSATVWFRLDAPTDDGKWDFLEAYFTNRALQVQTTLWENDGGNDIRFRHCAAE